MLWRNSTSSSTRRWLLLLAGNRARLSGYCSKSCSTCARRTYSRSNGLDKGLTITRSSLRLRHPHYPYLLIKLSGRRFAQLNFCFSWTVTPGCWMIFEFNPVYLSAPMREDYQPNLPEIGASQPRLESQGHYQSFSYQQLSSS